MKKIWLFMIVAAFFAAQAQAQTFEFPFKNDVERKAAASVLANDPAFINFLVMNVFQSRLNASGNPNDIMSQALGNMTADNGMVKNQPEIITEKPQSKPMENKPVDGMKTDTGMQKSAVKSALDLTAPKGEKIDPVVALNDPSVENVDFFLSLSCDHCRTFWKKLVADDIVSNHLLNDKINIHVIPNSTADAGIIIIFETLRENSPQMARDFLTWYFTGGRDSDEKVMFRGAEQWLRDHKQKGLADIHQDKDLLKRIGDKVEKSIALDQKYDAAYPSIYVNGKEDGDYFTKARNHIISQLKSDKKSESENKAENKNN